MHTCIAGISFASETEAKLIPAMHVCMTTQCSALLQTKLKPSKQNYSPHVRSISNELVYTQYVGNFFLSLLSRKEGLGV
jgi:hypothetical protein